MWLIDWYVWSLWIFEKSPGNGHHENHFPMVFSVTNLMGIWCSQIDEEISEATVSYNTQTLLNKANLRDLIAATGLVILLKFDPNLFFSLCDLEIWCMTSKNNRAPLLYYIKLSVSFQIHRWIQTEVTLQKRSIQVEISVFLSLLTLKFDGWPW